MAYRFHASCQNRLFGLNWRYETIADEIRLTAQLLIDIKTKVLGLYNNEDILCALTAENQILLYNVSDKSSEHINGTDLGIVKADNIEKIHIYNDNVWICDQTEGIICYNTNTKTSRTLNDNSQSSFIQKDIRDIIQIDKTTFIIATWSSLSAIRFETDNYLQSPFHIVDLTQHDSYYAPILKNRITDISYFIVQRDTVDIVSFEIQFQQSSAESSYPKHIVGLVKMNVGNSVFEDC